jgi:CDP-diacylglycerol--serine O-phosphatidyltransferase
LLDKADGAVARVLRATSDFGLQMDSLVDLVAFGVAPAVLGYTALRHTGAHAAAPLVTSGAAVFYVICVCGRLAHFNTTVEDQSDTFRGIPSTLGGGVLAGIFLVWATNGPGGDLLLRGVTGSYVVLGILMVAPLRLPKIKRRDSFAINFFTAVSAGATYVFGFSRVFPELLLLIAVGYLVIGLFIGTAPQVRERRRAKAKARSITQDDSGLD